jgi:hypothetical protein
MFYAPTDLMMIATMTDETPALSNPVSQALDQRAFSSSRMRVSWSATDEMLAFISATS